MDTAELRRLLAAAPRGGGFPTCDACFQFGPCGSPACAYLEATHENVEELLDRSDTLDEALRLLRTWSQVQFEETGIEGPDIPDTFNATHDFPTRFPEPLDPHLEAGFFDCEPDMATEVNGRAKCIVCRADMEFVYPGVWAKREEVPRHD